MIGFLFFDAFFILPVSCLYPPDSIATCLSDSGFDGAKALNACYAIPLHEKLPDDFLLRYCHNLMEAMTVTVDRANKNE